MQTRYYWHWLALISTLVFFSSAFAQNPVKLELTSYKVIVTVGEEAKRVEKLVPATEVAPGDVLEWRLRAVNTSDQALKDVAMVIPIPPQTYYQKGSAVALTLVIDGSKTVVKPQFSFDGGKTFGFPPLFKEVKIKEDGKEVVKKVQVPPEEYTHARWVLPVMQPGETVEVFLRTVVR
ncbi:hypothetical protein [Oceanithermus sp.]